MQAAGDNGLQGRRVRIECDAVAGASVNEFATGKTTTAMARLMTGLLTLARHAVRASELVGATGSMSAGLTAAALNAVLHPGVPRQSCVTERITTATAKLMKILPWAAIAPPASANAKFWVCISARQMSPASNATRWWRARRQRHAATDSTTTATVPRMKTAIAKQAYKDLVAVMSANVPLERKCALMGVTSGDHASSISALRSNSATTRTTTATV